MAHFSVQPSSTTGVVISAASSGNRARFISLGVANTTSTARMVTIFDGTAQAGTARWFGSVPGFGTLYFVIDQPGKSIIPKHHFTAGAAIEVNCDGSSAVNVYGDIVREP